MLRENVRDTDIPKVGNEVYIGRENDGWVGPATFKTVEYSWVTVLQNGRIKTTGFTRVRRLGNAYPQNEFHTDIYGPNDNDENSGRPDQRCDDSSPESGLEAISNIDPS